jgi:hypothetical protein
MRINARLDQESENHLRYLQKMTGKSYTEIMKESLACYYQSIIADSRNKNQQLLQELAGIATGPDDGQGSVNYKKIIAQAIDAKYSHR